MAQAWSWAAKTGNLRKNPVHGEEEARLILSDKFEAQDVTGREINMEGAIQMEENPEYCPCTNPANPLDLLKPHALYIHYQPKTPQARDRKAPLAIVRI